jgi:AbrB family looped-hinge helix DNA binding protein
MISFTFFNCHLSSKGQLTIPYTVRAALNIQANDPLSLHTDGERIIIEKGTHTNAQDIQRGRLSLARRSLPKAVRSTTQRNLQNSLS